MQEKHLIHNVRHIITLLFILLLARYVPNVAIKEEYMLSLIHI